ncbi:MAG: hypothetical protein AB7S80_02640 [Rhizobiaceae bacterium]
MRWFSKTNYTVVFMRGEQVIARERVAASTEEQARLEAARKHPAISPLDREVTVRIETR